MALTYDPHQGRRVKLDAAAHIEQASAAFHLAEPFFIEQPRSLFRHRCGHHHKVCQRQRLIEFVKPEYLLCRLARTLRVLPDGDDTHSRRMRHLRQRTPDRAEADDQQRRAANFARMGHFIPKSSCAHTCLR